MKFQTVFTELKRRNLYKVAAAYGVVAWSLIQIATQLTPEGIRRRVDGEGNVANRRRGGRWLFGLALGFATMAIVSFSYAIFRARPAADSSESNSVAVLPFASLSEDKENAYFATGIQDEVLTRLAKIGGLKVISRTSTERYRSAPENVREIARQLGVAMILEGTVQKSGQRARINVQLIKAETDSHLWAEIYDRELTDLFAVESDVAEKIARSLNLQLTGGEKKALSSKSTDNPAAYEAYLRGLAFEARAQNALTYENIVRFFGEAVSLDPKFALAWAHLSTVDSFIYFNQWEHTPGKLAAAKQAADTAVTLQPDLGEAYLARGYFHYYCELDYAAAGRDFEEARKRMPNDSEVLTALAYLQRREGQWDKALRNFEVAARVDPRNVLLLYEWGSTNAKLRNFAEARTIFDRALEVTPDDPDLIAAKAATWQAEEDLVSAAKLLQQIPAPASDSNASTLQKLQLLYERRYPELAARCKTELAKQADLEGSTRGLVLFLLGLSEMRAGDGTSAQAAFTDGRKFLEGLAKNSENDPDIAAYLARNCAALGDRTTALAEGSRAVQLTQRDAMLRPLMELNLAQVHALLGDTDDVVRVLPSLLIMPAARLTPALLRLDPAWDAIAKDDRFQQLAAGNR